LKERRKINQQSMTQHYKALLQSPIQRINKMLALTKPWESYRIWTFEKQST